MTNLRTVFGGPQQAAASAASSASSAAGLSLTDAAKHPKLSRYFNPDGTLKVQEAMKASDDDLRSGVALLHPEARQQLHHKIVTFKPSMGQSIGARAMGIDIDVQKKRMAGLLGGEQKMASDDDPSLLGTTARTGLGAFTAGTGLGAAAHLARTGHSRITPSLLQMGTQMVVDPEHGPAFQRAMIENYGQAGAAVVSLAEKDPGRFRSLLAGRDLPGVSPAVREGLQKLVFGGGAVADRPGDAMLHAPFKGEFEDPWTRALTGTQFNHVAVMGSGGTIHDIDGGDRQVNHDRVPVEKWRGNNPYEHPYVRLRPTGISDAEAHAAGHAPGQVYDAAGVKGDGKLIPYNHKLKTDLQMREIVPELNAGGKNLLSSVFDRIATRPKTVRTLASILPEPAGRLLRGRGIALKAEARAARQGVACPGGVCSSLAANGVEAIKPGVLGFHPATASPGDFARSIGGATRPVEINLPTQYRNPAYLERQHLLRYGPLGLRAPAIAALGTAGLYGGYKGLEAVKSYVAPPEHSVLPEAVKHLFRS